MGVHDVESYRSGLTFTLTTLPADITSSRRTDDRRPRGGTSGPHQMTRAVRQPTGRGARRPRGGRGAGGPRRRD